MSTISYEIKCCPIAGYWTHWYGQPSGWKKTLITSKNKATKKVEKLARKGHKSIALLRVERTAITLVQPLPDAGTVCRKWYGSKCELKHKHLNERGEKK